MDSILVAKQDQGQSIVFDEPLSFYCLSESSKCLLFFIIILHLLSKISVKEVFCSFWI